MVYFSAEEMTSVFFQHRDKWKQVIAHTGAILVGYRAVLLSLYSTFLRRVRTTADPVLFVTSYRTVAGHPHHRWSF